MAPGVPGLGKSVQQNDRPGTRSSSDVMDADARLDVCSRVLQGRCGRCCGIRRPNELLHLTLLLICCGISRDRIAAAKRLKHSVGVCGSFAERLAHVPMLDDLAML